MVKYNMKCKACQEAKKKKNRKKLVSDKETAEALRAWVYIWSGCDDDVPFDEAFDRLQEVLPWSPLTPIIQSFVKAGKL